jgi:hypothetical protein
MNKNNNNRKGRSQPKKQGRTKNRSQGAFVATSKRIQTRKPQMRANADTATITHREYVADISGSNDFSVLGFSINPGLQNLFPWLSKIAVNYETYKFLKLAFHYETAVSTTTGGSMMLAADYDAYDATPTDKRQLMSYAHAERSAAWQESCFTCRPGDLTKFVKDHYVRTDEEKGDLKTYDIGNFFMATQGTPSGEMGELYVSYTIQLSTPQLSAPVSIPPAPVANLASEFYTTNPQSLGASTVTELLFGGTTINTLAMPANYPGDYGVLQLEPGNYSFNIKLLINGGPVPSVEIVQRQKDGFGVTTYVALTPPRVTSTSAGIPTEFSGYIVVGPSPDTDPTPPQFKVRVTTSGAVTVPINSTSISFLLL